MLELNLSGSIADIETNWRALEEDHLNSLYHSYDWCAAWIEACDSRVAIVQGKFQGKTAFVLPLEIIEVFGGKVARFIAAPHGNISTGLFAADFADWAAQNPDQAADELKKALKEALKDRADLLLLENLPLTWRGRRNPLALLPLTRNQNSAYQLPLKGSLDETLSQLNAKTRRRKFRIQSKRLGELGGFEYLTSNADLGEQHRLLDLFFEQKSKRLEALGFKNVFSGPEVRQFFHAILDRSAGRSTGFRFEMHALRLKGAHENQIAAIAGIARKGDHVLCEFSSIDDGPARDASPGEFLFWQMIAGFHDGSTALFDFGIGDQNYKRSWAPCETKHYDAVLPISQVGHIGAALHRSQSLAKRVIKSNDRAYRWAQRLRRALPG